MNKARFLIIFPLVVSGIFSGCNSDKKSTLPSVTISAPTLAPPTVPAQCSAPSIFTQHSHVLPITTSQLSKMTGTFKLSSMSMYSLNRDSSGTSFSAEASIKVDANGVRDTKLRSTCSQPSSTNGYVETLPVIMTLYLPSFRVTEFDMSDEHDLPATNHPTFANFISDSKGNLSLKNAFSAAGPYSTSLTLTDWMTKLPAQPTITLLDDGSLEMRIHWDQGQTSTDGFLHFETQK